MGETSKWTAQREMTLIEDMNCSFNRLIEKGNNLTAERDRYKAGLDDAMHLLMNHNHHADPEWVSGYEDLGNRYSKIKEG
jgi:hypothetical protein